MDKISSMPKKESNDGHQIVVRHPNLRRDLLLVIALFLTISISLLLLFKDDGNHAVVVLNTWRHEIKIERFDKINEQSWCDAMPDTAELIGRERKIRSHKQVRDREECIKLHHDNKDGTFKETQKCRTIYKNEPVYDDYCQYRILKWRYDRSEFTHGSYSNSPLPWPKVNLEKVKADNPLDKCNGCEREAEKVATYLVQFKVSDSENLRSCEVDYIQWLKFIPQTKWRASQGRIGSKINCESLQPMQ